MTAQEQFPNRPSVTAYLPWEPKSGLWYFEKEFAYNSPHGAGVIPVGFETDFGSVPKAFRNLIDDDDPKALCPFLRHDHRYTEQNISRDAADLELRDGMRACGAGWWKAQAVYLGVRVGGASHWNKKAQTPSL